MEQHFAVVIRADGTVPFDADVHPDHKRMMIAHLAERGHAVAVHPETGEVRIHNFVAPKPAE